MGQLKGTVKEMGPKRRSVNLSRIISFFGPKEADITNMTFNEYIQNAAVQEEYEIDAYEIRLIELCKGVSLHEFVSISCHALRQILDIHMKLVLRFQKTDSYRLLRKINVLEKSLLEKKKKKKKKKFLGKNFLKKKKKKKKKKS